MVDSVSVPHRRLLGRGGEHCWAEVEGSAGRIGTPCSCQWQLMFFFFALFASFILILILILIQQEGRKKRPTCCFCIVSDKEDMQRADEPPMPKMSSKMMIMPLVFILQKQLDLKDPELLYKVWSLFFVPFRRFSLRSCCTVDPLGHVYDCCNCGWNIFFYLPNCEI